MKKVKFGNTAVNVSAIGIGTWGYGGYFKADNTPSKSFEGLLHYALDHGINFIDTAEAYAEGRSETILGKVIKHYDRQKIFIASKVSPENLHHSNLIQSADKSLARLQCDYIDLYQIHWPNQSIPHEEYLSAIKKLVDEGKVLHFGLSNFSIEALKSISEITEEKIQSIQVEYNLFDRSVESDLLPYCQTNDMSLIAYSPLDQGKPYADTVKKNLLALSKKYHRSPAQIVLNYLSQQSNVIPIPKTTNIEHLKEICSSCDFALSLEDKLAIKGSMPDPSCHIPPDSIEADKNGLENFNPGVDVLAKALLEGESIKPVRVIKNNIDNTYNLVEGKLRYWAWVEAFGVSKNIPAQIRT